MIIVVCPGCRTKLKAKDELAGQVRKCPKCGGAVRVQRSASQPVGEAEETIALAEEVAPDQHVHGLVEEKLPPLDAPERLARSNRYLIFDPSKLMAAWENNGNGWMLRTSAGYISATRNPEKLPAQGIFTLVELHMEMTDEGVRLRGLSSYHLADRWALTLLERGDDDILAAIKGPGSLNKQQKAEVRKYLQESFMRSVWTGAHEVFDYLLSSDYHSPFVGVHIHRH